MLKMIAYHTVMLIALLNMGHTKYQLVNTHPDPDISSANIVSENSPIEKLTASLKAPKSSYYKQLHLDSMGLSEEAFSYAIKGLDYLSKSNIITQKNIVSIVDFSKPSSQKRLYVIDISSGKVLFNTWVAHGRNSGNEFASQFSNSPESHQSSLGFYSTLGTYIGRHGYSLRLKGCENGINNKAYERAIVIHGADYVSGRFINNRGMTGRSFGCPAIPTELSKKIIDVIKDGSCLFLYHPTKKYCTLSKILNSQI